MNLRSRNLKIIFISIIALAVLAVLYFKISPFHNKIEYKSATMGESKVKNDSKSLGLLPTEGGTSTSVITPIEVTHITTPKVIKSVYLSSWVAGSEKHLVPILKMLDDTELNAVVIDVKDSTGRIGFHVSDPELEKEKTTEARIPNVRALTNRLHQKNIYIIGRVAVFQDPYMANKRPEWAITKKSDGSVWKDRKGLSFLDPAKKDVAKYVIAIAKDAYEEGFDEINFDYVRYPSDGNIKDINYHLVDGKSRSDNLEEFFKYLSTEVKKDKNIPISADLFGLTTEVNDDMGIGQVWEKAMPYFDFIDPMIYPSHYPPGQYGFKNPADHPYEVISKSLAGAINKTKKMNQDINKIRPWLQDFNLGAVYTKDMVKAQMKAVYDSGLKSWMLWDPKNKYTPSALELEVTQ
jgi:hypothetical protein